jgi:ribonuclease HI/exonuclease III
MNYSQEGIKILQYNVMKSRDVVMATLLRDPRIQEYDILALQEPWRNPFISTTHNPITHSFHLCFPSDSKEAPARVCFFINKRIDPNRWRFTDNTRDLSTLEITTTNPTTKAATKIYIHNVYNPPRSSDYRTSCLPHLRTALSAHQEGEQIILGDFNLHHELWGGLTVRERDPESDDLIDIMEEYQLSSLLPADTVTYDDKNAQTCIDLCYGTQDLIDRVIKCGVDHEMDHNSDHLPITTILDLRMISIQRAETRDWSSIEEKELRTSLARELPTLRCPRSRHALDRYVGEVTKAIQSAIERTTPLKRWSSRARAGWTSECKETQAEARRLKRRNARLHTDESWEAYRVARNQKGRVIRKALLQGHRNQVESAIKSPESMWKLARWARIRGEVAPTTTPILRDPATNIEHTEPQNKAKLLKATFFPTPPEPDLQDIHGAEYRDQISFPDITEREVLQAIASTPPKKAPGPDGIINKVLHIIAAQLAPHLTRIYNWSLRLGYCPAHFRQSTTVVLRKPGKDDYTIPKAYRPIALLNTISKLMDSIIARRISYVTEVHQLLPSTHIGGRKGRSVDHALHTIIEKVYEAWNSPEPQVASLLLLDVSGAFDNVSHARLLHNLRKRKIDERTVRWIASFLTDRSTIISFDAFKSEVYQTTTGIPQGSPLSPILYLYYNADLIETCNREPNTLATGYIDDIAILRWGSSIKETCNGLEKTMQRATVWAKRHASVFAPSKFQLTHHTRRRQVADVDCYIQIEQTIIHPSESSKYLGVTLDTALNWKQHIQNLKIKISKSIGALASLAGSTWGAGVTELRKIYQAVVIPQMMYGCSAWSVAHEHGEGYTKQTIDSLKTLQAKAGRIIGGAYKATSGPALDVELHLLPIEHQIWKTSAETVSRILSSDRMPTLAGFQLFRTTRSRWRKEPYLSPLEHTYRRLRQRRGASIEDQEVIPPFLVPPWWQGPIVRIASCAKTARTQHKEFLKHPSNSLFVYTDGSGINNHVGAAAVSPLTRCTKLAYMGDSETSTVYAAELQGIRLALQIADEDAERGNKKDRLIIFTDNQAAIRTFQKPTGKSGAYIVADAIQLIDKLQGDRETRVELRWVPAHTGIWGNEAADRAAKRAAKQNVGAGQNENAMQTRTYHLQATLKTWVKRQTRAEWTNSWKTETRGRTTFKHTPQPSHKILRLHHGLKKWQSALLIQMRTEKIGLRDFLWKRRVREVDDPGCDCGEGRQTVDHILLRCRTYNDLRRRVFGRGGRIDLRAILNEPKLATKAIRFMEQTHLLGQFRSCDTAQRDEVEHWGETEGMSTRDG